MLSRAVAAALVTGILLPDELAIVRVSDDPFSSASQTGWSSTDVPCGSASHALPIALPTACASLPACSCRPLRVHAETRRSSSSGTATFWEIHLLPSLV